MVTGELNCHFCGRLIPSERHGYRRVIGWERLRAAGGTNALAVREPQPEWACDICIGKLRRGLDPGQQTIL